MTEIESEPSEQPDAEFGKNTSSLHSEISLTTLVYALQAVSFFLGITYIAAVVINYVKRAEVQDTWLESHFRWQIRTFWFSVLWSAIGVITWIVFIGWIILGINAIWVIYRIVKGWLCLADGKPMYAGD